MAIDDDPTGSPLVHLLEARIDALEAQIESVLSGASSAGVGDIASMSTYADPAVTQAIPKGSGTGDQVQVTFFQDANAYTEGDTFAWVPSTHEWGISRDCIVVPTLNGDFDPLDVAVVDPVTGKPVDSPGVLVVAQIVRGVGIDRGVVGQSIVASWPLTKTIAAFLAPPVLNAGGVNSGQPLTLHTGDALRMAVGPVGDSLPSTLTMTYAQFDLINIAPAQPLP